MIQACFRLINFSDWITPARSERHLHMQHITDDITDHLRGHHSTSDRTSGHTFLTWLGAPTSSAISIKGGQEKSNENCPEKSISIRIGQRPVDRSFRPSGTLP